VAVGTYSPGGNLLLYVAVGSAARGASAPTEGGEGRGHIVAAPAQLVKGKNEIISEVGKRTLLAVSFLFDAGLQFMQALVQASNINEINSNNTI